MLTVATFVTSHLKGADMKTTIATLWRTDARLTAVGFAMMALLAATGVALLVDPREVIGAPVWMKPAKFAASIAIFTLTLAWVFSYLPDGWGHAAWSAGSLQ